MIEPQRAKESVRRYFDAEVTGYLDAYDKGQPGDARHDAFVERRELVLAITPPEARRILDIGAGPGVFTTRLVDRGADCFVVDLSYEMIAAARRPWIGRRERPQFMVGDIDRLPFADGSFDAALCIGVLQYLPSVDRAFGELARVVASRGYVIVTFPNASSPLNVLHRAAVAAARRTRGALERVGFARRSDPSRLTFREDIPNRFLSTAEVERSARRFGFRIDEVLYHVLQFPFSMPGLGFAIGRWNHAVRGRRPRGRFVAWGREGIMRLQRP